MTLNQADFILDGLAFSLGPQPTPINPMGLPSTLPFHLVRDPQTGVLSQARDAAVEAALATAYESGSLLGPAMDDTPTGQPYAFDFLAFAERSLVSLSGRTILEIGSGRGYFLKLLGAAGARAIGIEPGGANASDWKRFGVSVVRGLFPQDAPDRTFEAIMAYAVLEHIPRPLEFLVSVRRRLPSGGHVLLSVPDCEPHIEAGDCSMLFHEHFSYFNRASLEALLQQAGFDQISVETAGYGGAIYAFARRPETQEKSLGKWYPSGAIQDGNFYSTWQRINKRLQQSLQDGRSVGFYCPLRAIPYLHTTWTTRFFDDDPELWGRYYPPFQTPIEGRHQLIEKPVDELWIFSRTFGARLRDALRREERLNRTEIILIGDVLHATGK